MSSTGRYSKVSRRIHSDRKVARLSRPAPNGFDCFMYLLTAKELSNVPGVMVAYDVTLARSLLWPVEGFREAFGEAQREGLAYADWDVGLVWVPNAIKHTPPESPHVVESWENTLAELPDCELKRRIILRISEWIDEKAKASKKDSGKAWREAWEKASPKGYNPPSPNQEQEQEQDHKQEIPPNPPSVGAGERARPIRDPFKPKPADPFRASFRTQCPDRLEFTEAHRGLCKRGSIDINLAWRSFCKDSQAAQKHLADWSAAFEGHLAKSVERIERSAAFRANGPAQQPRQGTLQPRPAQPEPKDPETRPGANEEHRPGAVRSLLEGLG